MNLHIKGPLPEESAERFLLAMNDTHVSGLINHCVEVMMWKRVICGLLAGVVVGVIGTVLVVTH